MTFRIANSTFYPQTIAFSGVPVIIPAGVYISKADGSLSTLDQTDVTQSLFLNGNLDLFDSDGSTYTGSLPDWLNPAMNQPEPEYGLLTAAQLAAIAPVILASGTGAAAANALVLQAALDVAGNAGGGKVSVASLWSGGVVWVDQSIYVPSKVTLDVFAGAVLKRADGLNAPLIRNKFGGQKNKAGRFVRTSNVVTVTNKSHGLQSGDLVWVGDLTDTTMHGVQTVTSATDDSWTYASAGSDGSGGASTVFGSIIPVRREIAGASFVSASNVVTVNDPYHDLRPGMGVWLGTVGASSAFVGNVEVVAVYPDYWQYVTSASGTGSATGSIAISYDYDIHITGDGTIDGNRANNGTVQDVDIQLSVISLGMLNKSTIDIKRVIGSDIRCVQFFNATDTTVTEIEFGDALVGVQYEGGATRTLTQNINGGTSKWGTGAQLFDDMVALTGTAYIGGQLYDSTVSPYGLKNFTHNKVRGVTCPNALNGVKLTAYSTVTVDNLLIEDISGGATNTNVTPTAHSGVRMVDDSPGLVGMICGKITIRRVNWFGGQNGVVWGTTGTCALLDIDTVTYAPNAQQTLANTVSPINIFGNTGSTGHIKHLRLRNIHHVSAGAAKPCIILGNGNTKAAATIQIDRFDLDGFDLTPNVNASGAALIKYGNATVLNARLSNGVFRGPASGTGLAIVCYGPDNMGRWTLDNVATVAGGTALSFVFAVANSDQTVCAGEIILADCHIVSASGIYDNATNWTGTLKVKLVGGTDCTFTGNLINAGSATGLIEVYADPTTLTTVDKVAGTLAGTLRVNGSSLRLVGSKVTAPQPGDTFWSTDTSTTASASIGQKGRTNAGAWAAIF